MTLQETTVPNLAACEKAYVLPTGEAVAISLARTSESINPLRLRIGARLVDSEGATRVINGSPAEVPPVAHMVNTDRITSDELHAILARFRENIAELLQGHANALTHLHDIPIIP